MTELGELFEAIHGESVGEPIYSGTHTFTSAPPTRRQRVAARVRWARWRLTGRLRRTSTGWKFRL